MKIYCSGIGGIGLSAYAAMQNADGHTVEGSDRSESALLEDLRSQGISVHLDQSGTHIPSDCELFVYSEALPPDAPERRRASELGIRQLSYPQALGELSKGYRVIAVCGTHGKSSTTGMASRLLLEAGLDPTIVVGTKLRELDGKNWRKGKGNLFLLEACEYKRSFMSYTPEIILLTNCDGDHFDYYTSIDDYHSAFHDFIGTLPTEGKLITHMQDPDCKKVAEGCDKGLIDADSQPMIQLKTPGAHMRKNAQLVLALGDILGLNTQTSQQAVSGYAGSWRRMELRGYTDNGIPVIDDYAHHPKEIRATLAGLREEYPDKRIVCVFQPHTHDRTQKLYQDFTTAFTDADLVVVTNVYDARAHADGEKISIERFAEDIASGSSVKCVAGGSLSQTADLLPSELKAGDLLAFLGAGDITTMPGRFVVKAA